MRVCSWSFLAIALFFSSCEAKKMEAIRVPEAGTFFNTLEEYHLFEVNSQGLRPSEALVGYDVINALFTDYAMKDRFVYLPEGQKAHLSEDGTFVFPEGSMLVKNFYYDEKQTKDAGILETRLLIRDQKEWKAISYVWNQEKTSAKISKVGAIIPNSLFGENGKEKKFDYVVPNKNQCKSCHNFDDKIDPLGFKYANLNKDILINGTKVNQISYLAERGLVELSGVAVDSLVTMKSYADESNPIDARAMAYLDVNCGHCHRPNGPGNTSGLFLQHNEIRSNHLGFCKGPVAAGKGSGGRKFDISPGSADSSILVYRISSLDPGVMMPEVGRSLVHEEGVQLVKDWINSLQFDCYE